MKYAAESNFGNTKGSNKYWLFDKYQDECGVKLNKESSLFNSIEVKDIQINQDMVEPDNNKIIDDFIKDER